MISHQSQQLKIDLMILNLRNKHWREEKHFEFLEALHYMRVCDKETALQLFLYILLLKSDFLLIHQSLVRWRDYLSLNCLPSMRELGGFFYS